MNIIDADDVYVMLRKEHRDYFPTWELVERYEPSWNHTNEFEVSSVIHFMLGRIMELEEQMTNINEWNSDIGDQGRKAPIVDPSPRKPKRFVGQRAVEG